MKLLTAFEDAVEASFKFGGIGSPNQNVVDNFATPGESFYNPVGMSASFVGKGGKAHRGTEISIASEGKYESC